jgi:hypothetical protein
MIGGASLMRNLRRVFCAVLAASALVSLPGLAADSVLLYTDPYGRFSIEFPKDWNWTPVSPSGEPLVVFVQPKKEAAIIVERFPLKQALKPGDVTELYAQIEADILKENQPTIIDVATQVVDQGGRRFVLIDYTRPGPRDRERVRHYAFPVGQNLYRLTCATLFDRFSKYESTFSSVFNSLKPAGALAGSP